MILYKSLYHIKHGKGFYYALPFCCSPIFSVLCAPFNARVIPFGPVLRKTGIIHHTSEIIHFNYAS